MRKRGRVRILTLQLGVGPIPSLPAITNLSFNFTLSKARGRSEAEGGPSAAPGSAGLP